MWYKIDAFFSPVFRHVQHMERTEWIGVCLVTLAVGFFCMRGFGSRSKY